MNVYVKAALLTPVYISVGLGGIGLFIGTLPYSLVLLLALPITMLYLSILDDLNSRRR